MIGFCAFGENPEDGTAWIVRFMVGAAFQRKGYGKQGLRVLVDHMHKQYECSSIFLDIGPSNKAGRRLYESVGFADTGKIQGESMVFRLDLDRGGL